MIATLAALVSVQGFLATLLPETLTYAASEMHVRTFGQGVVFASVELSALPALLALVLADRRGRRSVVLWATGAAAVLSELGGFTPSIGWLTVTQVAAGALLAGAGIAAVVVAVEEVPRRLSRLGGGRARHGRRLWRGRAAAAPPVGRDQPGRVAVALLVEPPEPAGSRRLRSAVAGEPALGGSRSG